MDILITLHCVAMFVFVGWMLKTFIQEWNRGYSNKKDINNG